MEIKKSPKADLENKKILFREIGLAIALLSLFFLFEWKTYDKTLVDVSGDQQAIAEEEMIPITQPETPPVEVPPAPTAVQDIISIVDDNIKLDNDIVFSTEDDKNLGVQIMDYVVGNTATNNVIEEVEEDIPVAVVEEKPKFMGGDENTFTAWLLKNFEYPQVAIENNIQGRIMVQFVVNGEGRVVDIRVVRSIDAAIDRELIRVIERSPRWTPGKQRGKAVRVKYTLPVNMQLR